MVQPRGGGGKEGAEEWRGGGGGREGGTSAAEPTPDLYPDICPTLDLFELFSSPGFFSCISGGFPLLASPPPPPPGYLLRLAPA